jgi:hypothetical protein
MKVQNAFRIMVRVSAVVKGLALLAIPSVAFAGGSVTATAPASVTILAPVTITAVQALDFGSVTKPLTAANTVTLDTSGNVTVTGSGNATHAASTVSAAKFNLVGDAGVTYSTTQSLSFAQQGLTNVSASAPVVTNGAPGIIPASGSQELRFGGAFDLSAATPIGSYTGQLSVTVNYN